MAKFFTYCLSLLLITLLLARISPTVIKHISLTAYEQPDYQTTEKFGEKDGKETHKSNFKSSEFISTENVLCFNTSAVTYSYHIFTPIILSSILEIPKRPPQGIS